MRVLLYCLALVLYVLQPINGQVSAHLEIATLNNTDDERILSHSDIGLDDMGALLCVTDLTECCRGSDTPVGMGQLGNWYTPTGDAIMGPSSGALYQRSRDRQVVRLFRGNLSDSTEFDGIYRCEIPVQLNPTVLQNLYVGIYRDLDSVVCFGTTPIRVKPPVFKLTLVTMGGPATTVQWTGPTAMPIDDDNVSLELLDGLGGIFRHTLTVIGHMPGLYQHFTDNLQTPSPLSDCIAVQAANPPMNALVTPNLNTSSILISWTAPASPPDVTAYCIYYETADNVRSQMVPDSATQHEIIDLQKDATYNIALSPQLPSSVVGPLTVMFDSVVTVRDNPPSSGDTYVTAYTAVGTVLTTVVVYSAILLVVICVCCRAKKHKKYAVKDKDLSTDPDGGHVDNTAYGGVKPTAKLDDIDMQGNTAYSGVNARSAVYVEKEESFYEL